jgi:hypothetical protein
MQEELEMRLELFVGFVLVAFHCGVFEGTVHALDLTIGPRVVWSGGA